MVWLRTKASFSGVRDLSASLHSFVRSLFRFRTAANLEFASSTKVLYTFLSLLFFDFIALMYCLCLNNSETLKKFWIMFLFSSALAVRKLVEFPCPNTIEAKNTDEFVLRIDSKYF